MASRELACAGRSDGTRASAYASVIARIAARARRRSILWDPTHFPLDPSIYRTGVAVIFFTAGSKVQDGTAAKAVA